MNVSSFLWFLLLFSASSKFHFPNHQITFLFYELLAVSVHPVIATSSVMKHPFLLYILNN